jgi:hypothetical protein
MKTITIRRLTAADGTQWESVFGRRLGYPEGSREQERIFLAFLQYSSILEEHGELACRGIFIGNALVGKLVARGFGKKAASLEAWFINGSERARFGSAVERACVDACRRELGFARCSVKSLLAFPDGEGASPGWSAIVALGERQTSGESGAPKLPRKRTD